jgi:hypothetical protein
VLGYLTGERAVAEPVRAALALGVSRNQEGYASAFEDLLRTNPALKKNKTLGAARELADIFKAPIEDPERLPTPFRGAPAGKEKDGPRTFLSSERLPRPLLAETGKALPDAAVARLLSRLKLIQDQEPDAELKSLRQALDKPSRLEFGRALVSAWQNAGTNRRYAWVHDAAVFLGAPAVKKAREPKKRVRTWFP